MDADLKELLGWLDFTSEKFELLESEVFTDFEDFVSTTKDEFKSTIDGFYKHNDLAFTIPNKWRELLYDILEWCGDFDRRDMEAGINWPDEEIVNGPSVFAAMSTARERAFVCKRLRDKGGDDVIRPEKFDPTDYAKWEKGLEKKLSSILGIKGVPIYYVTRVKDLADAEDILDKPFIMKIVLLAPLIGTSFEADLQEVYHIIVATTTGTDAEQFLKAVAKYKCGCRDMNIMRALYKGTGSNNRIMLEAKMSLKHIHYKNERTMPYASFVAKLTGIFQVLSDGGQEKGEAKEI